MRYSTIALTLAATAAAAPTAAPANNCPEPPKSQEFAVAFTVGGAGDNATYVSANLVRNGTSSDLVISAERLSVYPGTPAYFNTTEGSLYGFPLNFDLTDSSDPSLRGVWGAGAPEVGDNYGYAANIFARKNYQQPEWTATNGTISHSLDAATNAFFACQDQANGEENIFLKFGVFNSNGQPPAGCELTRVVQNFNVPGGLQGSQ